MRAGPLLSQAHSHTNPGRKGTGSSFQWMEPAQLSNILYTSKTMPIAPSYVFVIVTDFYRN